MYTYRDKPLPMTPYKRIVHLSSVHYLFDTRIFHKECKSLSQAGYDVSLIVQHDSTESIDGIHIIPVPRNTGKYWRMIKTSYQVYRKALTQKADLYHFHDPELIPYGLLLKKKGYKVIYDVHEDVPNDILTKGYIPKPFRKIISYLMNKFEIWASGHFDHIITVNKTTSRFENLNSTSVKNYPDLQSLPTNDNLSEKEDPIVTYIGSITEIRCAVEMVEAVNIVGQKRKVKLIMGGNISPKSLLFQLKRLDGWHNTDYRGWVNREEIVEIMSKTKVGLVVLKPIPNHLDALATKLLEYLALGVPVISSDLSLHREIIEKNNCGIIINSNNAQEIADAIQWFLEHPIEATEMGERGRRYVLKNMNWNMEKKKLLSVYNNILMK